MINKNHMKDHRKFEAIYDCLRSTVFHVVRESIKVLFKLNVNCQCCNNAVEIPKTTVLRRPIPATYANSRWQIDLKKMPPVKGYNYICNIVDCFSRLAFGGPLKGKFAKDVAELTLKYVYLYGPPRILQRDNGKEFTNANLAEVVSIFKTRQIHGRPYHPQSQGRVERFNRTLTEYFRKEMSLEKDWPSKLPEFYYNYNNRVHKSTKPSTPYQLYFKRPNFAPPIDEQLPFVLLTEDERKFLAQAHLDVEVEEEEIGEILPESNINENENGNLEMLRNINDRDVTFEEAMDIVSEPNEEHQEVQETNKGRQLENDHIVTETGDTYFTTETDDIANLEVTGGKSVMNNGLMDYFQKRQLEIYPLEMFSDNYQDIFTHTIGEYLQFKTNPAMNKGTAVFTSGFWREGICQNIKNDSSRGKIFVIKDIITSFTFELNRYQLRPNN
ncbi:unnamed protein product [Mytilus coruscus]|uniref:Integrase catalytic domain-containing protein n=1 Tax=Mytilus coruscus TaxID=42192 RepID=A0A6J8EFQ4_MYTCO|nr:unnamed protein product [Mytilus coruscus]